MGVLCEFVLVLPSTTISCSSSLSSEVVRLTSITAMPLRRDSLGSAGVILLSLAVFVYCLVVSLILPQLAARKKAVYSRLPFVASRTMLIWHVMVVVSHSPSCISFFDSLWWFFSFSATSLWLIPPPIYRSYNWKVILWFILYKWKSIPLVPVVCLTTSRKNCLCWAVRSFHWSFYSIDFQLFLQNFLPEVFSVEN